MSIIDDTELVLAAREGDRDAFAAIYDRHADRVHDFCWSLLRNRHEAADATQDTFLIAAERLGQLREPSKLKAWLFAIARHEATRRGRARARLAPAPEEVFMGRADGSPPPDEVASTAELTRLVWDAARGLDERDRVVMDLSVRQGLATDEIAAAIGVRPAHASVLVNRMRERVERSLGALLVARLGRRDCPELRGFLSGWDGTMTVRLRKQVARHADGCERCHRKRSGMLSPLALLGGVAAMAAPAALRPRVLDDIQLVAARSRDGWRADGFPPSMPGTRRPPVRAVRTAAAALMLVSLGWGLTTAFLTAPEEAAQVAEEPSPPPVEAPQASPTPEAEAAPPPSPTPTPSPSPTPTPPAPAALAVSPGSLDFGANGTTMNATVGNPGGSPLAWTATAASSALALSPSSGSVPPGGAQTMQVALDRSGLAEGTYTVQTRIDGAGTARILEVRFRVERAPEITDVRADPDELCVRSTTRVTATVTDESGLESVLLEWEHGSLGPGTSAMSRERGDIYETTLGPFEEEGQMRYRVSARDARGNTATSPWRILPVHQRCAS